MYMHNHMYMRTRQRQCYSASRQCVICASVGASQSVDSATQPVDRGLPGLQLVLDLIVLLSQSTVDNAPT